MELGKTIGCRIHGHIKVSKMALRIIDTPEFQRMRLISQLGLCSRIFPAANHTRFEHSIGVYHLASEVITRLQYLYPDRAYDVPHLGTIKLDKFNSELIKIAGLCHDIGHGPFSHIFDDILEEIDHKSTVHNPNISHEHRSCLLVKIICERELSDLINESHILFIQSLIHPDKSNTGALYQIISNNLNGIDVDKFDYLARDPYVLGLKRGFDSRKIISEMMIDKNGNIAYAKHSSMEIYDLFQTRYMMHKQIYNHRVTKIVELMVRDIIKLVEPTIQMFASIDNMTSFCSFTDNTIFEIISMINNAPPYLRPVLSDVEITAFKIANQICDDLTHRRLYKSIASDITDKTILTDYLEEHPNDCLEIVSVTIGFVSGNKADPFDSIYFHNKQDEMNLNSSSFVMKKKQISTMICDNYKESFHFLVCKDIAQYEAISASYTRWISERIILSSSTNIQSFL